ncbi:WYL domain-containing protein [Marinomonas agarivorans]|nr:WYL domain-containing protein [Marinomonas agarivorans]
MSRTNTYQRLERLEKLTAMLKAEGVLTTAYLAETFGISERTLFRDIAILRQRGLPIDADKGRGGGIRLHRNWGLGRLQLESQEMIDILLSLTIAERMNSTLFMGNIASIKHKLMASFSTQQKAAIGQLRQRIHIGDAAQPNLLAAYHTSLAEQKVQTNPLELSSLQHAFLFTQRVEIGYKSIKGEQTQRVIEPHYLYLSYPVWYVLAWDELRQDFRIFRCDRLLYASLLVEPFRLKPLSDFTSVLTQHNVVTL